MATQDNLNGEQLKMFMTPAEIMSTKAPLEGDRHTTWGKDKYGTDWERKETNEEVWERKASEARLSMEDYHEARGSNAKGTESSFLEHLDRGEFDTGPEYKTGNTDEYDKRYESYLDNKYLDFRSKRHTQGSLLDSVRESGVQQPVRIGPTQVTGGHHRIAAAHKINPDMLIPVLHETVDHPVRNIKQYPYT